MNIRPKDPTRVRQDALRVATRKLADGCTPCADAYIDLARRNGASEEEIGRIYPLGVQQVGSVFTSGFLGTSSMGYHRQAQAELRQGAARDIDYMSSKKILMSGTAFAEPVSSMPINASAQRRSIPISSGRRIRAILEDRQGNDDPYGGDSNTPPSLSQGRFAGPYDFYLVFCQPDGKPLHLHNIASRDFRRVTKGAKVPRIRFHDLRHSHATDLLAHGEHPKVVQERLGHYDPAFTLRVYSHVLPGMQTQAAARLEERLFGQKTSE